MSNSVIQKELIHIHTAKHQSSTINNNNAIVSQQFLTLPYSLTHTHNFKLMRHFYNNIQSHL